jgi:hypothetical protein
MFTKHFWMDAAERAVKTFFQVFLAVAIEERVFNAFELDWQQMLGIGVGAALISVATSVVSSRVGSHESASIIDFDDE